MEDNINLIEGLFEKTVEYGKSSLELAKLKAIDKTSDVLSTSAQHLVVLAILIFFMLFLNLGLAFWLGQLLGEIYFGFFVVSGFYGIAAILIYSFMRKWIKRQAGDFFVKQMLK
jgi:hypothetical protein